jgi:FAD-dependent oxidoreductase family protein
MVSIEPQILTSDVVIYGGSPSGVISAVRAARLGLDVTLVSVFQHVGGTMTNGLSSWDTQYGGKRSPLVDEWVERVVAHYRDTYGDDSEQYRQCMNGPFAAGRWPHIVFEPHVVEHVFEGMIAEEGEHITVLRNYEVAAVTRSGRMLRSITCRSMAKGNTVKLVAPTFVDASYELDLGAMAGVAYHVGRESREDFGEQHAGRLFMHRSGAESDHPEAGQLSRMRYPRDAAADLLDIRPWWGTTQEIFSQSTGEGDGAVQAYNFRVLLSNDPDNRISVSKPTGYRRERYLPITQQDDPSKPPHRYAIKTDLLINPLKGMPAKLPLPNHKIDWNAGAIPGAVDHYPDGDWTKRHEIMAEHRDYTLGLLYFLQTDESVPESVRIECAQWGLAADEFADNRNFPYELYVREARRLRGRTIFTEHDARFARGIDRSPIHHDSIAIAEWLMDSHDCSTDRMLGSYGDGWTSLSELTRPSQVPYSCMLPVEFDNLIVSVCVSATHVGWGTLRLEPVWMSLGEVAAHSARLAADTRSAVGTLDVNKLQQQLASNHSMLTFINFFDVSQDEEWIAAVQYLGTKGLFWSYDARLDAPFSVAEFRETARRLGDLVCGRDGDPAETARALRRASLDESTDEMTIEAAAKILPSSFQGTPPEMADISTGGHLDRRKLYAAVMTLIDGKHAL